MRTTINLDDQLLAKARLYTRIESSTALVHEALTALVQREAARRLALLGGTQPDIEDIPRRRTVPAK
jgi:Arc/MetJ family transcription regulator